MHKCEFVKDLQATVTSYKKIKKTIAQWSHVKIWWFGHISVALPVRLCQNESYEFNPIDIHCNYFVTDSQRAVIECKGVWAKCNAALSHWHRTYMSSYKNRIGYERQIDAWMKPNECKEIQIYLKRRQSIFIHKYIHKHFLSAWILRIFIFKIKLY